MHESIEIRKELGEATAAYQAAADRNAEKERELHALSRRVKELQQALAASLCAGAVPCSRCGQQPIGLRHVRGTVGKGGVVMFRHVFEVGCICATDTPEDDRRGFFETQSRPNGPELDQFAEEGIKAAVAEWNRKNTKK